MQKITKELLNFGQSVAAKELFPVVIPDAEKLITSNPYAFAIGVCLDRGMKADIIWTIPYDMQQELGHLDPLKIYEMSLEDLEKLFVRLPRRPRFVNAAPRTIQELTIIVVEECNGDAANIWKGKRASQVNRTFTSIHGVGPGIANMGVLLIEAAFGIHFDDIDRKRMDIKPDVQTKKVLFRLGASDGETEEAAIQAARLMNPEFPGELDGALWWIGRKWCFASNPDCRNCPLDEYCLKRL